MKALNQKSTICFSCHKDLSCFTQCCRDVNIFLTPYDILRMKKRLGISSGEFLSRYTLSLIPEQSGFPVVILKMCDDQEKSCPFVDPAGCSIYEDRPWACRMYPLDRGEREGEFRFIAGPSICIGMEEKTEQTVKKYFRNQGVEPYSKMEKPFRRITSHPRLSQEKIGNQRVQEMCRMALYDIDRFRRFVLESRFLEIFHVKKALVERLKEDDMELMKLAYKWLEFGLISGETLKIREDLIVGKDKRMKYFSI
jgi:Fe-S-cluster containining protein